MQRAVSTKKKEQNKTLIRTKNKRTLKKKHLPHIKSNWTANKVLFISCSRVCI